jgi:hypothetical protein
VPPYVRKTSSLEAALPWLYLKGIYTGEMHSALEALGLSLASFAGALSVPRTTSLGTLLCGKTRAVVL